MYYIW